MSGFLCSLTTSAAGNWAGLIGTALLALAAFRILPLGKRLYRINTALLQLADTLRTAHATAALPEQDKPASDVQATLKAVQISLEKYDLAYASMLSDASTTISTRKDKLTRWDAAITIAGLASTLASNALPLASTFCQSIPSIGGL